MADKHSVKLKKDKKKLKFFLILIAVLVFAYIFPPFLEFNKLISLEIKMRNDLMAFNEQVTKVSYSESFEPSIFPLWSSDFNIYDLFIKMDDGGEIAQRNPNKSMAATNIYSFGKYTLHDSCTDYGAEREFIAFVNFNSDQVQKRLNVKIETIYDLLTNYQYIQTELSMWQKNSNAQTGQAECYYVRERIK